MNSGNILWWVLALLASPLALAVFGSAISQIAGPAGSVASDSLSQMVAVIGIPTVAFGIILGVCLYVLVRSDKRGLAQRRSSLRTRNRRRKHKRC